MSFLGLFSFASFCVHTNCCELIHDTMLVCTQAVFRDMLCRIALKTKNQSQNYFLKVYFESMKLSKEHTFFSLRLRLQRFFCKIKYTILY